ncbi:hypothetical protein B0T16DRAFT_381496 [Cercophora newfieldiana]|uniref:Uncharacterized protein n=1 Tax=Cercophora newfieldiana TaxID=92897 RepID=A0AA39XRI1_9PEZI|nr:hypothetical protein B0T16DRAFT_381496 [Cercophora newfieldiana]
MPRTNAAPNGVDLGWQEPEEAYEPLITGLPNEELWKLIRRFDKQTYHVKSIPKVPRNNLDLEISNDEVFTPVKFKTHVERLYMTAVVGAFHLWKHLTRLRSWREWKRTSMCLAAYTIAWALDSLLAALLLLLVVLILFPSSREFLFPPVPPSMIDPSTAGVKKPSAGVLGSGDSLTGAPEKHPGEAVEQEAHSFVTSVITVGCRPDVQPRQMLTTCLLMKLAYKTANVRSVEQDKTKKPVAEAVFGEAATVSHHISLIADTYERFGNALSPTAPFPRRRPSVNLASCLLFIILMLQCLTGHTLLKSIGFLAGFGFFGDPLWKRTTRFLDWQLACSVCSDWRNRIDPRNTILYNVPTNAQLTLALLRLAEASHAPLPPAPSKREPPEFQVPPKAETGLGDTLGIDQGEVNRAMEPDPDKKAEAENQPRAHPTTKHRRVLNFVKGLSKGVVNSGLAADRAISHMGSEKAKFRAGVLRSGPTPRSGPDKFAARFEGKKGWVTVNTSTSTPTVSWSGDNGGPTWTMDISEISEIQKIGGLGWKTKIAVSWATEDEITDGILIKGTMGHEVHLTAMPSRDQLFNRLVAIGGQIWGEW